MPDSLQAVRCAPDHEVRFAVVIYGGVSLAIYINGIVQEMLRMVRATAPREPGSDEPLIDQPKGSEAVYRRLGQILESRGRSAHEVNQAIEAGGDEPIRCRFVIDVLSGTSAGGINAMFLAKALANDQPIAALEDLWIAEGDIESLINDKRSLTKRLTAQKPPQSLLNSQRMYMKLLDALDGMDDKRATNPSPLVDQLDLFSTNTDIVGLSLPIALSDKVVEERRHRNVFHFRHPAQDSKDGSDFKSRDNPFLAYAARCTSAFPFAFEPMALADIFPIVQTAPAHRGQVYCDPTTEEWRRYYDDYDTDPERHGLPFDKRAFGDGGYLDNKPFSYAVETVFRRQADLPVSRKLVYIEPSPEAMRPVPSPTRPDALENSLAALLTLPRYETIREDLERIVTRNLEVERLDRVIEEVKDSLDAPKAGGEPKDWLGLKTRQYGGGYATYERLKLSCVTDDLVQLIVRAYRIDPRSGYVGVLRNLAGEWRQMRFPELALQRQFLLDFDLDYRLRRLRSIRRQINEWHQGKAPIAVERDLQDERERKQLLEELGRIKEKLKVAHDLLQGVLDRRRAPDSFGAAPFEVEELELVLRPPETPAAAGDRLQDPDLYPHAREASSDGRRARARYLLVEKGGLEKIDGIAGVLRSEFRGTCEKSSELAHAAFADEEALNDGARAARAMVRGKYDGFEAYDAAMFPITFGTNMGEGEHIDIHRISPDDALALSDVQSPAGKVKGQRYGAFGAFLDRSWRENDILWGRLDAAERLIAMLLPGRDEPTVALRTELIGQAQQGIVVEALHLNEKEAVDWKDRLAHHLATAVRSEAEPELMARSAARATAVTGQLLEDIAEKRGRSRKPFAKLTLIGRMAWELVEVSAPRTFGKLLADYWLQVLALSALVVCVLGAIFSKYDVLLYGIEGGIVLAVVYGLRSALNRFMRGMGAVPAYVRMLATLAGTFALALFFDSGLKLCSLGSADLLRLIWAGNWLSSVPAAAVVVCLVTGWRSVKTARAVERPDGTRVGMNAVTSASSWESVRSTLGPQGHPARDQVRRHLRADYPFIAAFTLLFVSYGISRALGESMSAWRTGSFALAFLGIGAGLADVFEDRAVEKLLAAPLPARLDRDASPPDSPRPYSALKWTFVAASVLLALALLAHQLALV